MAPRMTRAGGRRRALPRKRPTALSTFGRRRRPAALPFSLPYLPLPLPALATRESSRRKAQACSSPRAGRSCRARRLSSPGLRRPSSRRPLAGSTAFLAGTTRTSIGPSPGKRAVTSSARPSRVGGGYVPSTYLALLRLAPNEERQQLEQASCGPQASSSRAALSFGTAAQCRLRLRESLWSLLSLHG
jgi:hypothetical protein